MFFKKNISNISLIVELKDTTLLVLYIAVAWIVHEVGAYN